MWENEEEGGAGGGGYIWNRHIERDSGDSARLARGGGMSYFRS